MGKKRKFSFFFLGTKGLGEYIIEPGRGCFVELLAFRFRPTFKGLQPSEEEIKVDSGVKICDFFGSHRCNKSTQSSILTIPQYSDTFELLCTIIL